MFVFDEHVGPSAVHQGRGHLIWNALKIANGDDLVDQEDRLVVGVGVKIVYVSRLSESKIL